MIPKPAMTSDIKTFIESAPDEFQSVLKMLNRKIRKALPECKVVIRSFPAYAYNDKWIAGLPGERVARCSTSWPLPCWTVSLIDWANREPAFRVWNTGRPEKCRWPLWTN